MSKNEDLFKKAEDAFFLYMKRPGKAAEEKLGASLSTIFSACDFPGLKKSFKVSLTLTKPCESTYGACVYPDDGLLDRLCNDTAGEMKPFEVLRDIWRGIDKWCIEIDKTMFDRNEITLTPGEFVAIMLHEIGHAAYSDKVIYRFFRMYCAMYIGMKVTDKESLRIAYSLLQIPLAFACTVRPFTWSTGIRQEYFADSFAVKYGYGEELASAFSKMIAANGTATMCKTEAEADAMVSNRLKWVFLNVADVTKRKNRIARELYNSAVSTNSPYQKQMFSNVLNKIGVTLREKYSGDAVECTLALLCSPDATTAYEVCTDGVQCNQFMDAMEATIAMWTPGSPAYESMAARRKAQGLPSWVEIDRIQIEIDKMRCQKDRTYVLDLIYALINEINEIVEILDDSDRDRAMRIEAQRMLDALNDLRNQVLAKRSFATNYRVFAPSPAGYGG